MKMVLMWKRVDSYCPTPSSTLHLPVRSMPISSGGSLILTSGLLPIILLIHNIILLLQTKKGIIQSSPSVCRDRSGIAGWTVPTTTGIPPRRNPRRPRTTWCCPQRTYPICTMSATVIAWTLSTTTRDIIPSLPPCPPPQRSMWLFPHLRSLPTPIQVWTLSLNLLFIFFF